MGLTIEKERTGEFSPPRKVLIVPELFTETFARTVDGYALRCDWGEPDAEGFYTPTFTVDFTDRLSLDRE